jgi:hypothetical protein
MTLPVTSSRVVSRATVAVLSFRIAYRAALIVAPARVAGSRWLGAREVGLHALAESEGRGAPSGPAERGRSPAGRE